MIRRLAAVSVLVVAAAPAGAATAAPPGAPMQCGAGARTLSQYGDHVYPDTGNGGYEPAHRRGRLHRRRTPFAMP